MSDDEAIDFGDSELDQKEDREFDPDDVLENIALFAAGIENRSLPIT